MDKTLNEIHKQFLLFHKYVYIKNVKEGWVRKLIHKTGLANDITDIKNVIHIKIEGVDHFCNHLHKYYTKQKQSEYYKYFYFFSDMIQELEYKNDRKDICPRLEKYLKEYKQSILNPST